MPNLPRILRHLFLGADLSVSAPASTTGHPEASVPDSSRHHTTDGDGDGDDGATPTCTSLVEDSSDPEAQYLSLDLGDKLDIVAYLCTLALGSKAVRSYVEESESQLTEFRKHRADVNKERKAL